MADEASDFISNKIPDKITMLSRRSLQNNSGKAKTETENMEPDRQITNGGYISPEKRQQNINDLKLI